MPSSPHLPKSLDVQVPYSCPKVNRTKTHRFKGPAVCRRLKSVVHIISPIQGLWLCSVPSRSFISNSIQLISNIIWTWVKIVLEPQSTDPSPLHFLTHIHTCMHTHTVQTLSSRKWVSLPSGWSQADPLHPGIAEVSLGGHELSAQSPTEEGNLRLTGSSEQSLEHWVSQGGWG